MRGREGIGPVRIDRAVAWDKPAKMALWMILVTLPICSGVMYAPRSR